MMPLLSVIVCFDDCWLEARLNVKLLLFKNDNISIIERAAVTEQFGIWCYLLCSRQSLVLNGRKSVPDIVHCFNDNVFKLTFVECR